MRFRYIDIEGREMSLADVAALVGTIQAGSIREDTLLYDVAAGRWARAGEHDVFVAVVPHLDQSAEEGEPTSAILSQEPKIPTPETIPVELKGYQRPLHQDEPQNPAFEGYTREEPPWNNWVLEALKKYAVFEGRAGRKEFWYFTLFNALVVFLLSAFELAANPSAEESQLASIYQLAVLLPSVAVGVRRTHDTGHNGWWVLAPFVNLVFWLTGGDVGPNRYGEDPREVRGARHLACPKCGGSSLRKFLLSGKVQCKRSECRYVFNRHGWHS